MKADDPMFIGTTCLELWRHDDECHIGLYYRSNGERDIYEMRLDDNIIPLHPDFPLGFPLAAHCLLHIAQSMYEGTLVAKDGEQRDTELKKLIDEWKELGDGGDR